MNALLRRVALLIAMCMALMVAAPGSGGSGGIPAKAEAVYTISYDANGGTGAPEPQTKKEGEYLTLSTVIPTRNGHTFLGWSTILTAETFEPGDLFFYDADTRLIAVWSSDGGDDTVYIISYDANGGTSAPEAQTKYKGADLKLSSVKPTRAGYGFEGWSLNKNAAKVDYQAEGIFSLDQHTTLYAAWKEVQNLTPFDVTKDAYPFDNTRSAFGYQSSGYPIPYDPSVKLLFGDSTKGKSAYREAQIEGWNGNCCGMATTAALLHSYAGLSPTDFGAKDAVSMKITDKAADMTLLTFIEAMQFSQKTPQFSKEWTENRVYNYQLASGYNLNALYDAVHSAERSGKGTVLALWKQGAGGHAIMAYGTEEVSDTELHILLYDCNFPNEPRVMTLRRQDAEAPILAWSYEIGGKYGVWDSGDATPCYLSYINYDTVEYIWTHRGNLYDNKEMLSVSVDSFAVTDFQGNFVASVENGIFSTDRSDIYAVPNLSLGAKDSLGLYMPRDLYTVVSQDGRGFEATMTDQWLSATAQSTSGAISFAVDDDVLSNTVFIENATEADSYQVSLSSGFGNVEYNDIVISGTGKNGNERICISGDDDRLSITNCNIDALSINGVDQSAHIITAYAGAGGKVEPSGDVRVSLNGEKTFSFKPDLGYKVRNVNVDGYDLDALEEYTFANNYRDHTITVNFELAFAITDAIFDPAANAVSVELKNDARAKLVCAVYGEDGAMIDAVTVSVKANCGEAIAKLSGISVPDGARIRVMLLDSAWKPLCKSREIRR